MLLRSQDGLWAAEHECDKFKEGVGLEPTQAMLRRKTNEAWTDKNRHVKRKLDVEHVKVLRSKQEKHKMTSIELCHGRQ